MKDVYISKYDAVKTVEKECEAFCPTKLCKLTEYIENAIEEAPVADVQPVEHGRWIIADDVEHFIAICSECGRTEDSRGIKDMPYCHCGARMDGDTQ